MAKKRVIIFGASSGVGLACARLLMDEWDVIAVSRTGACNAGKNLQTVSCDITNTERVEDVFKSYDRSIDAVINCVGIGAYAPFDLNFADYWREIVETNMIGALNIMTATTKYAPDCSSFIGVTSAAAKRPSETPGNDVYSASKLGFSRLHQDFRLRLRQQNNLMKVCLIEPAFVQNTGFGETYFRSAHEQAQNLYSNFKALEPVDVARTIKWCLETPAHVDVTEVALKPVEQTC